jgi:hypothetical protein
MLDTRAGSLMKPGLFGAVMRAEAVWLRAKPLHSAIPGASIGRGSMQSWGK